METPSGLGRDGWPSSDTVIGVRDKQIAQLKREVEILRIELSAYMAECGCNKETINSCIREIEHQAKEDKG